MNTLQCIGVSMILIVLFGAWLAVVEFTVDFMDSRFNGGWSMAVRGAYFLVTGVAFYYFGGKP